MSYVNPLGAGGFADVFLYRQDMPARQIAVKVLLATVVDAEVRRMFNAEADVLARLSSHPSILTIYQASISADGRPYIAMEYCPMSLGARYRQEKLAVPAVLDAGVRIACALETAHRAGVLHRDIKPSNILVTEFGNPVLSDFGIAAALKGFEATAEAAMTVPWSAREVLTGSTAGTIASEVWSLGAAVYSLLAGRSPFEQAGAGRNDRDQLIRRIDKASYTPIGRTDVPAALEQVLVRSMERNPAKRYGSALEVAQALQATQAQLGLAVTPLDVPGDHWGTGEAVRLDDDQLRGAVRASVEYTSKRKPKPGKESLAAGGEKRRRGRRWPLVIGGVTAALLIAGGTVAVLILTGVLG